MKSIINWRIFFILLSLSLLSVLAVFPYVVTLQRDVLKQLDIPISVVFIAQFIQSVLLFSVAIFSGLYLGKRINFHSPVLEALVTHRDYKKIIKDILFLSILLGCFSAVAIYVVDYLFTMQGSAITTHQNLAPIWQKLLAAFYGGITEEVLTRLFLMTLFIWVGTRILKQKEPVQLVIVFSILIAAIIFGLGHLPLTASLIQLTPLILVRAVVLNGIGGVVFGWLYWKKGLEAAMIAHFSADIFLLTVLPLLFG
jgi:membrane protease YdiL (CAAX protease family)